MRALLLTPVLLAMITIALAFPPSPLERKFPKAKSVLPLIEGFPALAQILASDKPWELSPNNLVTLLFPSNITLVQGSESLPLLYAGRRTQQWPGTPVWNQFAYEIEYYVFDPARPVIRFHIGRPLDVRMQTLEHKQPAAIKTLYPLLADSVRMEVAGYIPGYFRTIS